MSKRTTVALSLLIAWQLTLGCSVLESANERGRNGNLVFTIDTGELATDFDNPVAIGAMLDITVKQARGGGSVELTAASFRTEGSFEVVRFADDVVTVRALDRGSSSLEVAARGSDGELDDVIDLTAEEAAKVSLSHKCNFLDFKTAQYGVGTAATLDYTLRNRLDRIMLGYGFAPLSMSPAAIELDAGRMRVGTLVFTPATSAGLVTVRSTVDDEELELRFVDPADIDSVKVNGLRTVSRTSRAATRKVWPQYRGERVCRAGVGPQVASVVGTNCSVEVTGAATDEHFTLEITPQAVGPCAFTLEVPETSVSESFEFQISDGE